MTTYTPRTQADILNDIGANRNAAAAGHPLALTDAVEKSDNPVAALQPFLTPTPDGTVVGAVQRFIADRQLNAAMKPANKEVLAAVADVIKIQRLSEIEAVRDRVVHNFLVQKTVLIQKLVAAAQLVDEGLTTVKEQGEDRNLLNRAKRLTTLNKEFQEGLRTQQEYEQRVLAVVAYYEDLDKRSLRRIEGSRGRVDAMLNTPATKP
jgi:hypothetical protein